MKIDFTNINVLTSFDGTAKSFNAANAIGNLMMYNGSILLDIGFEDLAKQIYYSEEAVEIPQKYAQAISKVVKESTLAATIKRELINLLANEVH